jgi:DNA-binding NtrC family response regulator
MAKRKTVLNVSRILVAADDPGVGNLFARKLRSTRYSVSEAKSGAETLRLLRSMRFQVLVLDLDMPDTDGFQVLKVVKTQHPSVRVLAISGYRNGVLLKAARCLGATFSLRRTSAPGLLVETVRKLLGEYR